MPQHRSIGIHGVAIHHQRTDARRAVLHLLGKASLSGDVANRPLATINRCFQSSRSIESVCQRLNLRHRLRRRKIIRRRCALERLQRCLLGRIGTQRILVGLVGRGPQRELQRRGIVVCGRELQRSIAARRARVRRLVCQCAPRRAPRADGSRSRASARRSWRSHRSYEYPPADTP